MNDTQGPPFLGQPPERYSAAEFSRMFRNLEVYLNSLREIGPVRVSRINVVDLPTSATGLRTGDLWNDAGTVKIV